MFGEECCRVRVVQCDEKIARGAGDVLLRVAGHELTGVRDAGTVMGWISGPEGSSVVIHVRGRDGVVRQVPHFPVLCVAPSCRVVALRLARVSNCRFVDRSARLLR